MRQPGWFVLFFVAAAGLMGLIFSGAFAGSRAGWGMTLLGLLLVVDLGRANLPWVIYWNYHEKYLTNPVVDLLRNHTGSIGWLSSMAVSPAFQTPSGRAVQDRLAAGPVPVLQHPVSESGANVPHA